MRWPTLPGKDFEANSLIKIVQLQSSESAQSAFASQRLLARSPSRATIATLASIA